MDFYVPINQYFRVIVNLLVVVAIIEEISEFLGVLDNTLAIVPFINVFKEIGHPKELNVPHTEQSNEYEG